MDGKDFGKDGRYRRKRWTERSMEEISGKMDGKDFGKDGWKI